MTASFRKIDYSLRPAKHAERRMLSEIFRRLWPFQPVEDYVYVGMGSLWFSDFILFHRALGIRKMISIERSLESRERFEANKPFRAVEVRHQETSAALPGLSWDRRHFIWLDYDGRIDTDMLDDVRTVATRAMSGSVLAVSVQCVRAPEAEAGERGRSDIPAIDRFRDRFGRDRVGPSVFDEDLVGWPFGKLSRSMFRAEIDAALAARAGTVGSDIMKFTPICGIEYEDDAKMTTLVGVFATDQDRGAVEQCGFAQLDFLDQGSDMVRINVPKLTMREVRRLERELPKLVDHALNLGSIPEKDALSFARLYRYFPNFAVMEH